MPIYLLLQSKLKQALADAPTLTNPTGDVNLSSEAVKALNLADSFAQKAGDEFLSTDWVMQALAEVGATQNATQQRGRASRKLTQSHFKNSR